MTIYIDFELDEQALLGINYTLGNPGVLPDQGTVQQWCVDAVTYAVQDAIQVAREDRMLYNERKPE